MTAVATQMGPLAWTIAQWQAAYRNEGATPETLLAAWAERGNAPDNAWIKRVDGAMLAKMRNIGEACTSANRFYVHQSLADRFAKKFATEKETPWTAWTGGLGLASHRCGET